MAVEIIDTYITCEIAELSGEKLVVPDDAGKNYAVVLSGNADSPHPQVKVSLASDEDNPVYGKLMSVTPSKNQCRVAIRGANMIYLGEADYDDADIGKGVVAGGGARGTVKPGAAVGSRDADEIGYIIGGSDTSIRVDQS